MPYEYEEEEEISLADIFNLLWRRKFMIIFLTFIFAAGSLIYAFTTPLIYKAECRIMPPQSNSGGRLAGLAAQFGGLADFVGLPSTATSGQMLVGVLKGNTVVDAIIDKFNLMEEMSEDIRLHAREAVLKNLEAAEDTKSGIISIAYLDEDPQKAADIANSFVDELQKKIQEISFIDAQQRRAFYEKQLEQAQQELIKAEDVMMNYQKDSGIIVFEAQAESLLSSIAALRSQIAAKNVQISSMQSYARSDNPRLRLAKSELEAMTKELRRLEEEQMRSDKSIRDRQLSGDLALSTGQIPELGIEYQRYLRNLKVATAKWELMLKQYESARLGEESNLSTISIIDPATPPDYKFKPKRGQICIIGTMAGGFLGVFLAFMLEHLKESRKSGRDDDDDEDDD